MRIECQWVREDEGVAVECVCLRRDTNARGKRRIGAERGGSGGRDARLGAGDRGVEAEGFHHRGVEEGEGVECAGGGEGVVVGVGVGFFGPGWEEDGWIEGSEFGAEGVLEGGVEGEFVH